MQITKRSKQEETPIDHDDAVEQVMPALLPLEFGSFISIISSNLKLNLNKDDDKWYMETTTVTVTTKYNRTIRKIVC